MSKPDLKNGEERVDSDYAEGSIHQPRLINSDGQEITLAGQLSIGRSAECSLQIEDTRASRRHALLDVVGAQVVIRDLDSHNGTWVNKQRIAGPTELHDGDQVRIGRTSFIFKAAAVLPTKQPPSYFGESETSSQTGIWGLTVPMTLVRGNDGAEIGLNHNMTIGRSETNDLVLKGDASASHAHARIELAGNQVIIQDLNSNNGTWVNGKRIAGPTSLKHGDKIRLGDTIFRLRVGDRSLPPLDGTQPPTRKSAWKGCAALSISALAIVLVVGGLILQITTGDPPPNTPANPITTQQAAAREGALRALVYVIAPNGNPVYEPLPGGKVKITQHYSTGSGSILNGQGIILTSFHVIGYLEGDAIPEGKGVGDLKSENRTLIGLNPNQPEAAPTIYYRSDVIAKDPGQDVALLQVREILNEDPGSALPDSWTFRPKDANVTFDFIQIGNSDKLRPEEKLGFWGYPGAGEDTPTYTEGPVSGFLFLADGRTREWIKTTAPISYGNSGGMAFNQDGQLIGIPTQFTAESIGVIVPPGEQGGAEVFGKPGEIALIKPINLILGFIEPYYVTMP